MMNNEEILGFLMLFLVILVILSLVYLINIEGPIIQSQVGCAGRKKKVMMKRREDARIMLQAVEESLLLCCFRSFHFTTKEEKTMVYEFLEKPPLFLTISSRQYIFSFRISNSFLLTYKNFGTKKYILVFEELSKIVGEQVLAKIKNRCYPKLSIL